MMGVSIANKTLELARTVGALNDAFEAIEDGADVNFECGARFFSQSSIAIEISFTSFWTTEPMVNSTFSRRG